MTGSDWPAGLDPPVPEGFRTWLRLPAAEPGRGSGAEGSDAGREDGTGPEGVAGGRLPAADRLREAARRSLDRALTPEGRERRGAFDLLAADAFLTWAAEAALDEERPETGLRGLVRLAAGAEE